VANRGADALGHRRSVGDGSHVARNPLVDHLGDVGMVGTEPGADDLRVGQAGEAIEVLLRRERLAVLGEELDEDLAQDRLVVRERAVEVEADRANHAGERI